VNTPWTITRSTFVALIFFLWSGGFESPLTAQSGSVVQVSTEGELQQAVASLASDTTIVIAPGTYQLTSTLAINRPVSNVTLRGASENANDVLLIGRGMDNAAFETVPHGISTGVNVVGITIANLTIRDVYYHAIMLAPGTESPRIQNVRLINAGRQFIKAYPDGNGGGVDDGLLERSVIEYTGTSRDSETNALEVVTGSRWTVRDNVFRNIVAPQGQVAGPAVLFWQGARDSVIERNTFINAQREIALGLQERTPNDHSGGIVRNNFLYREGGIQGGQPAIYLADSPNTQVLHNTVLANGSASSLIQYRYRDTRGVVIRNNLLDGQIAARNQATGTVADNHTGATPSMFVDAAGGNLHLASGAADVVDRAPVQANAGQDFDGQTRPQGAGADFGADEFTPGTASTTAAGATTSAAGATTAASGSTTAAATLTASAGSLPSPWQSTDIGKPQVAGAAGWSSGVFIADGAGTDIGGNADQFRFIYQTLDGDGEFVARIDSLERTDQWAKAGIMIRDELTAGAKHTAAVVTSNRGVLFQRRIANDAVTAQTIVASNRAPVWFKLVRKGNAFTAYRSSNGTEWSQMRSEVVYLNRLAYVGLVVTSRDPRQLSTARFSNVKLTATASAPNQSPAVSLTAPANGATYTAPATMSVGATASDTDGTIAAVEFYAGSTMIGSDTSSPYSVTWSNAPAGTHALTAVARDNGGASTTSSSRQITISTPQNSVPSVALTSPANGASFNAPASVTLSATASDSDGSIARVDFYAGTTAIGSDTTSPYSATWSNVPAGNYAVTAVARDNSGATGTSAVAQIAVGTPTNQPPTVSLSSPSNNATFTAPASVAMAATAADADGTIAKVEFYAGSTLVATDASNPFTATWSNAGTGTYTVSAKAFDNAGASTISAGINVTIGSTPTPPPPADPAGWQSADVGSPFPAGSATYNAGVFTITSAGNDVWDRNDQLHYVYWPLQGDGSISACAQSVGFADAWTKAGVMIRGSLSASAPHAFALLSAGNGATFLYRPAESALSAHVGQTPAVAPHCLRIVRSGNVFRAFESVNGTTWNLMGEQTITMPAQALIGLALSSAAGSTTATATFGSVSRETSTSTNQAPLVSLTAPANGTTYTTPATMSVSASASDSDGTIAAVEFYTGSTLIGSDNSSPFSVTWSNAPSGTHTLTAVARDNVGATTTSSPRQVTISAPSNTPPSVSLTSPATGATFTAPASVSMAATATDTNGSITKVEFYAGSTLVATDTSNPFTAAWSNAGAGTHTLTAKAFDNGGASTTSAGVIITISSAPSSPPPTDPAGWQAVDIGNPYPAGSSSYSSGVFTVTASGTDIWDQSDQLRYVYWPLDGDGRLSTCVQSLGFADAWTKAGVMIRGSLSASAPHAFAVLTAGNGATFLYRTGESQQTGRQGAAAAVAPHCVRIERSGNVFRAYESLNGTSWNLLGEETINMPTAALVGLALSSASANGTTTSTARFGSVSLETTPNTNQPPQVSLTTPANNASFVAPATVQLGAAATDADGSVASVSFYAGGTLIGTDTAAPWSYTWSNVTAGTHSITAVARDNQGATRTSAAVSITVTGSTTPPPSQVPHSVVFDPSSNHDTSVNSYVVEFFPSGADTATATPSRTQDVGKPTPVSGEISVDVATTIQALPAGTYVSTVRATGPGGTARSAPSQPFVR
jgi:regulation of enolase protein 1 (concanavalin A-like superfamily)